MFLVTYIDECDRLSHKGGFNSDKEAYAWINNNPQITPLKLLIWSDQIDCYDTYKEL